MAEVGLLTEGPGTELIEGLIYPKMPQGRAHILAARSIVAALRAIFAEGFDVNAQFPLPLGENEPEPDVLVLRGGPRDYEARDPDPRTDVVLAVEVSDTTLAFDRRTKAALYARHGVPEYWIVNLREKTLEIRRKPTPEGYAETTVLGADGKATIGEGTVAVSDVLPTV